MMKKTKRKIFLFLFCFVLLITSVGPVHADDSDTAGTDTDKGGDGGGTINSAGCYKSYNNRPKTYMIDLVKKTKTQSKYTIIASAVVGVQAEDEKSKFQYITSGKRKNVKVKHIEVKDKSLSDPEKITDLKTLAQYLNTEGSVSGVKTTLSKDNVWTMLKQLGVAEKKNGTWQVKDDYKKYFTLEQSPGISDNYGYRILIQEFHNYWTKCNKKSTKTYLLRKESQNAREWSYSCYGGSATKHELILGSRDVLGISKYTGTKPWDDYSIKNCKYNSVGKGALGEMMNGAGYNAIWIPMDDVTEQYKCEQINNTEQCAIWHKDNKDGWKKIKNVKCNGQTSYKGHNLTESCPQITAECTDSTEKDGYGICRIQKYSVKNNKKTKMGTAQTTDCNNLTGTAGKTEYDGITLTPNCPFKPKWNYDIDAACENCDSTTTGGSYQVQDVVDWEAVLHSTERNDNPTLQTYYDKGNGVLCKESFNVVFPNNNNVKDIHINKGRYFTVNEKGSTYINGVYNFEPIKITRTRQCISTNTDAAAAQNALTTFSNKKSIKELGTVSLKYNEKYKDSKYNTTQTLIADQERIKNYDKQFSSTVVAGQTYQVLTDTTEGYFKIKDSNLYRFISIQNGLSQSTKPADTSKYIDVQKPNLPISLKNEEGATVALYYELPNDSKLASAVKSNKANYLEDKPTYDNVYQRNINPSETACAKMYGLNTDKYNKCKAERSSSKKADVTAANKCLVQLGPNATFKYICDIIPEDDGDKNCYPIATSKGEEQKYICKDGNVCDAATYAKECGPKCVITNGKYYGQNGVEVSKEEYERQCPGTPLECGLDCPECGYCCPDTTMMCAVKDANGNCSCPGKGNKIIYRPIDLTNPFPGQTNYQRATGSNWCARLSNGKTTCKNTNSVVTRHITNNRSTANEGVYRLEPLYKVELNATNIKEIRKYNSNKNYEDFTLSCDKGTCKSNFLRDRSSSLQLSGVCNSSNYDELRRCAERGAGK